MSTIRNLFETTRSLDRRIEKVISFDNTANDQLKREITEYVVTDSIETSFERLLNCFDQGMGGSTQEIGIWVSGFYGSGKSSFTKYLGFALDPTRTVDGKPFLDWLENQLVSRPLRAQLRALAKRYPSTVIMIDLASAQIAGATMAEISSVLYWTVMQWAGYPKDRKVVCGTEPISAHDRALERYVHRLPPRFGAPSYSAASAAANSDRPRMLRRARRDLVTGSQPLG